MKPLAKLLFALTAVAAVSFAYPAKANLITNPGFETGDFTGWTFTGVAGVLGTFNNVAPHSGNFQAEMTSLPNFSASLSQSVATTPGATYTVDFFAAAATNITPNFTLNVTFGGTTIFSHIFNSNTGYTEYTFIVPASASSTALMFTNTGIGSLLLDDISVTP